MGSGPPLVLFISKKDICHVWKCERFRLKTRKLPNVPSAEVQLKKRFPKVRMYAKSYEKKYSFSPLHL